MLAGSSVERKAKRRSYVINTRKSRDQKSEKCGSRVWPPGTKCSSWGTDSNRPPCCTPQMRRNSLLQPSVFQCRVVSARQKWPGNCSLITIHCAHAKGQRGGIICPSLWQETDRGGQNPPLGSHVQEQSRASLLQTQRLPTGSPTRSPLLRGIPRSCGDWPELATAQPKPTSQLRDHQVL